MKLRSLLTALLTAGLTARGATILETLDPASTRGNYFGGIYFSFSVANDSSPDEYGQPGTVVWRTTLGDTTLTNGNVTINLGLHLGGPSSPDEMNFLSYLNVNDPNLTGFGTIGEVNQYDETGWLFHSGTPAGHTWTVAGQSDTLNLTATGHELANYGFTLNINFDGSVGTGTGEWYFKYAVPQPTNAMFQTMPDIAVAMQISPDIIVEGVPEPSSWLLGIVGALALGFWRRKFIFNRG